MTKPPYPQVAERLPPGWVLLLDRIATRIPTGDFATGLALVDQIGAAAEAAGHHPDLDLRYTAVGVRLSSHDEGGVTERDLALARTISDLAVAAGLTPSALGVVQLELGLDTPDRTAVVPFWAAVLGATARDIEVVDETAQLPTIWFQKSGRDEPRQRWHHDLWVDPAEVQPRIDAAVAAGGRLVSDTEAPSFWVLADPEGNRICLCTWQDRQVS
ncbi:VOC family protein [Actinoplanes sp. NPDC051411]|uniref:VOC family protein n=1 Tax=Actinoplanes sp. NPDC051411 TaxID=3155522 RepID=UPI00344618D4